MNVIEKLNQNRQKERIEELVLNTHLEFFPWNHVQMERDCYPMKDVPIGCTQYIEFARGRYDNYAAPVVRNDNGVWLIAYAKDEYYFCRLALLAFTYSEVYEDIRSLYVMTSDMVSQEVLQWIERRSLRYGEDANLWHDMMLHVYYGMIAEEHYARLRPNSLEPVRTKMGKLMKMHALHRVLIEHVDVIEAANECVNMNAQQVIAQSDEMGLLRHVTWQPYQTVYDDVCNLPIVDLQDKKGVR